MGILGESFMQGADRPEEALPVLEAELALMRRYWSHDEANILSVQTNLSNCLDDLGRHDEALVLKRGTYASLVAIHGVSDETTITAGLNLLISLNRAGCLVEAQTLGRELATRATEALGADHILTLKTIHGLVDARRRDPDATRETMHDAAATLQDVYQRQRRLLGATHPDTRTSERDLTSLRRWLA